MTKARIYITLKKTIMDAQGQTVQRGLHNLGYAEVKNLRIGKYLEMELEVPRPAARRPYGGQAGMAVGPADLASSEAARVRGRVEEMCARLLANPIVEDFRVEIEE